MPAVLSALVLSSLEEESPAGKSNPAASECGAAGRAPQAARTAQSPTSSTVVSTSNPGRAASDGPGSRSGRRANASQRKTARAAGREGPPGRAVVWACGSVLFVLCDPVDGIFHVLGGVVGQAVLHEEGVLATVLVVVPQHAHRLEALGAEEQLRREVRLAHLQRNARAAVA